MPEGDSVHKVARALGPRLVGQTLERVELRRSACEDLIGARVAAVEAWGKHLLIELGAAGGLRVHLGMKGTWHRYPPGARWKLPVWEASLVLGTAAEVVVCFRAKEVERVSGRARFSRALESLGPDLLALARGAAPGEEATARERAVSRAVSRALGTRPGRPLCDLLLDQTLAAGLGNVYKSELLWLFRLHPLTPRSALAPETLRALYLEGSRLLEQNLGPAPRTTRGLEPGAPPRRRGEPRYYVYERAGTPCARCDARVVRASLGDPPRGTYWCPSCQPEPGG